jgi:arabinose-5-phosphate isomerase
MVNDSEALVRFYKMSPLNQAKQLVQMQSQALSQLIQALDEPFLRAIDLIQNASGKIIFSGVGKSGWIAQKAASTFCSLTFPSFFVHPTEAAHGDLGALSFDDILIVFSNSGETPELAPLIQHALFLNTPLIAITAASQSSLAQKALVVLAIPQAPEICPLSLAPTTSTLLMLALADVLAVSVMREKNVTLCDYSRLHPYGSLGQRLKKVHEKMRIGSAIPLISDSALLKDTLVEMAQKGLGCVGVYNKEQKLSGIVSDGDLRRYFLKAEAHLAEKTSDMMTPSPQVISSDALIDQAIEKMSSLKIHVLFVVDDENRPIGIISLHDCLNVAAPIS